MIVAVGLDVLRAADARIGLNGGAAARLIRRRGIPAAGATPFVAIEGMIGAPLMAHLMRHKIDIEGISGRTGKPRNAARF